MRRHLAGPPAPSLIPPSARRLSRAAAPATCAALIAGALAAGAPAALTAQATGGGGSARVHAVIGCSADDMAMQERTQLFRQEIVRTRTNTAQARGGDTDSVRIIVPRQASAQEEREIRALVEAGRSASGMFTIRRRGPSGWMGASILGPSVQWVTHEGQSVIRYCAYPEVVSVEPASPARRAGIVAGDTVIAYNGRDVTKTDVVFDTLLVPGARVRMSVRREGRTEDRLVTIARRPDIALVPSTSVPRSPTPPAAPGAPTAMARASSTSSSAEALRGGAYGGTVAHRMPLPIVSSFNIGRDMGVIAGAQIVTIDDELRESLKLDRGLLVLKVPRGSPAYDSGLRAGDVIQSADGQALTSPAGLARAMQSSTHDRTVRLEIKREKKQKAVALRW
jgi:membrane-associated protease RseP (regulator of RpoE activity)